MLKSHVEASLPGNSFRFAALLLLISNLRLSAAKYVEKTFFEKIIGSAKIEKLLCDMFQS